MGLPHPTESLASPSQLHPLDPANVRWYLPSWRERLALMGWRNVLWLAPIALTVFIVVALITGWFRLVFWIGWWKLILVAYAAPLAGARKAARQTLERRPDPFCIHCGYSLAGLDDGHACPECGEMTSHNLCRAYQRDPLGFIERYQSGEKYLKPSQPHAFEAGKHRVESADGT